MAKFNITITETMIYTCGTTVEAENEDKAKEIVQEMFENNEFEPHDEHFEMEHSGVEFNVEGCPG